MSWLTILRLYTYNTYKVEPSSDVRDTKWHSTFFRAPRAAAVRIGRSAVVLMLFGCFRFLCCLLLCLVVPAESMFGSEQQQQTKNASPPPRDPIYLYSSLAAGVGSGALASVLCAPLDLVRTRLQVWGAVPGVPPHAAILGMVREIVAREGYRGCFRGLGATLITVPAFWGVYCK